jgi:hypothetical protein
MVVGSLKEVLDAGVLLVIKLGIDRIGVVAVAVAVTLAEAVEADLAEEDPQTHGETL